MCLWLYRTSSPSKSINVISLSINCHPHFVIWKCEGCVSILLGVTFKRQSTCRVWLDPCVPLSSKNDRFLMICPGKRFVTCRLCERPEVAEYTILQWVSESILVVWWTLRMNTGTHIETERWWRIRSSRELEQEMSRNCSWSGRRNCVRLCVIRGVWYSSLTAVNFRYNLFEMTFDISSDEMKWITFSPSSNHWISNVTLCACPQIFKRWYQMLDFEEIVINEYVLWRKTQVFFV